MELLASSQPFNLPVPDYPPGGLCMMEGMGQDRIPPYGVLRLAKLLYTE